MPRAERRRAISCGAGPFEKYMESADTRWGSIRTPGGKEKKNHIQSNKPVKGCMWITERDAVKVVSHKHNVLQSRSVRVTISEDPRSGCQSSLIG